MAKAKKEVKAPRSFTVGYFEENGDANAFEGSYTYEEALAKAKEYAIEMGAAEDNNPYVVFELKAVAQVNAEITVTLV